MDWDLELRPQRAEDEPLVFRIFASTREDELRPLQWPAPQVEAFLRQQHGAQQSHYRLHYSDARFDLIWVGDRAAGRLYVRRMPQALHVIDISLLPEFRGQGIGSRLFGELLREAAQAGQTVSIHVERHNPARHLYDRLGFRVLSDAGVYLLMEWKNA